MTILRITLEWRFVELGPLQLVGHLALVARESGQSNGDGYAISGNPSLYPEPEWDNYGYLQVNKGSAAGSALGETVDAYPSGTTESDRHAVDISSSLLAAANGRTLDQIWADMSALATQINDQQFTYDPSEGLPPAGVTANSNSLIASVLALIGLDVTQYIGGTPPDLGFPGDQTILSGSGDDYMRAFGGNDTFLNAGGGNDILHGGDGTSLIRSDLWDGKDTVLYKGYSSVEVSAETNAWSVTKNIKGVEFTDTLHSMESFGNLAFRLLNKVRFSEFEEGRTFEDKSREDLISLEEELGGSIQALMQVNVDGVDVEFFNFGTIIGTNYADAFNLNHLLGREFDGGNGTDEINFVGYTGGHLSINLESGIVRAAGVYASRAHRFCRIMSRFRI